MHPGPRRTRPTSPKHSRRSSRATPSPPARLIIALIPGDGVEPPTGIGEAEAEAAWAAASIPWHPALLATVDALPRTEDAERAASPLPHEIRVVAAGAGALLPSGYRTHAADAGAVLHDLETGSAKDRPGAVAALLARLGHAVPETLDDPIALDFLALGSACRWLRDTTGGDGPRRHARPRKTSPARSSPAPGPGPRATTPPPPAGSAPRSSC